MRLKNPFEFILSDNQKNIEVFNLIKKKDGINPAIITIDGFLNEGVDNVLEWEIALKEKYPLNAWYHLNWQSENFKKLLRRTLGVFAKLIPISFIPTAFLISIPQIGWGIGGVVQTWLMALKKSEQAGKLLSKELMKFENNDFILIGHSLGSRVIYNCLDNLRMSEMKIIYDIHLLGGAVSNNLEIWLRAENAVKNNIYNYYSYQDKVLQIAYKLGTFDNNPIGRTEIATNKSKNINVTHIVNSHMTFKNTFGHYIQ